MKTLLRPALVLLALFTLLTGVLYPAALTGLAQVLFPRQANGSLLMREGQVVGSALVGQPFSDPRYFWSRPSATAPTPYNAAASSGSNVGPTHPALRERVQERLQALRAADPGNTAPVPVELLTASASGLDPHLSPAAVYYQLPRVARARGLEPERLRQLVQAHVEPRTLRLLGEPRVNVLALNLALDDMDGAPPTRSP
jgi:potassium-transporting ATPase KdpC subunit